MGTRDRMGNAHLAAFVYCDEVRSRYQESIIPYLLYFTLTLLFYLPRAPHPSHPHILSPLDQDKKTFGGRSGLAG